MHVVQAGCLKQTVLKYLATKDELPKKLRPLSFLQDGLRKEQAKFIFDQTAKYQTTRSSAEIEFCNLPRYRRESLARVDSLGH